MVLILLLLGVMLPMKNTKNLEAAKENTWSESTESLQVGENMRAGAGEQGELYLEGEKVTIKSVPVIEEWNIYGLGMAEPMEYIRLRAADGSVYSVYCLDYGKKATTGTIVTGESMDSLEKLQKERLETCLSIGFHEGKDNLSAAEKAEYAATQAVVWNIMCGIFETKAADTAAV